MAAVQRIYVTISLQPQTEGGATEYMPVTRYIERTEQKLACPAHGHTSNVASPTKKPCVRQSRNLEIFGALVRSLSSRYLPHARLDTFRMLICAVAYAISRCDSDYGLSAYYVSSSRRRHPTQLFVDRGAAHTEYFCLFVYR